VGNKVKIVFSWIGFISHEKLPLNNFLSFKRYFDLQKRIYKSRIKWESVGVTMRCFECGSANIGFDKNSESKYCRECGLVIEENNFR